MQFMKTLLDIAYETFALKTSYFDRLNADVWRTMGIENWVQTELVVSLQIRDIPVTVIGKWKRQCDLIVGEGGKYGVELRCSTSIYAKNLLKAISDHPKADLYLFLTRFDDKLLADLEMCLAERKFIEMHRKLNDQWMVMVTKRE